MTLTLELEPEREASELREILGDLRGLLKIRMKRPDATGARIVVVGKILNAFDDLESHLPSSQPEGAGRKAALAA